MSYTPSGLAAQVPTLSKIANAVEAAENALFANLPSVVITTTGSTFSPLLQLVAGSTATVSWIYTGVDGGLVITTGLNPTINFGSAATRTVYMYATDATGRNALADITVFNIGYSSLDLGPWSPSSSYNYPVQPVSNVKNIKAMTGLVYFLAEAVTGLTGPLDFTGMSSLLAADMHNSTALTGINLAGCTSLKRLSVEQCSVKFLDLTPVAATLADIRCAFQQNVTTGLNFAPLPFGLPELWHLCPRDNQELFVQQPSAGTVPSNGGPTAIPTPGLPSPLSQMTSLVQLWPWNCGLYGAMSPVSPYLTSLNAHSNWFSSLNVAGLFPPGMNGNSCDVQMQANQLTSVNLTGCGALGNIVLNNNPLTQAQVDGILAAVDAYGTSGGTLNLQNTAAPSAAGLTHKTNLTGRGWTVTTDASGALGGGFGSKYTYGESGISKTSSAGQPLRVKLYQPVNFGDLLVAAVEGQAVPKFTDSSGNAWTVIGPLNSFYYLAYCLSAASSPGGLTVGVSGGGMVGLAVSRFTPSSAAVFGASASANGVGAGGYGQNTANNMGNLGTVPAGALAWGVFFTDSTGAQTFSPGFQSGGAGTPDFVGAALQNSNGCAQGSGVIIYVPGTANAACALTWNGGGTGAGGSAVSAYFT